MQVKDIFTEICNRAGEGYQNYTERALAHFKTAITTSLYTSPRPDLDAPFLYRKGRFNPYNTKDILRLSLGSLFREAGLTEGRVHLLKYCPDKTAIAYMDEVHPDSIIIFYAKDPGEQGNDISIKYLDDPSAANSKLSIDVSISGGKPRITVMLGKEDGRIITTANDLLKALPHTEAWLYINASLFTGSSGEEPLNETENATGQGEGTGEFIRMEAITEIQKDIVKLRPELRQGKRSIIHYSLSGEGDNAYINIIPSSWFDKDGTVEFAVIGWDGNVIKKDGTTDNVEAMFNPAFLDMNITVAAELLRQEIMA